MIYERTGIEGFQLRRSCLGPFVEAQVAVAQMRGPAASDGDLDFFSATGLGEARDNQQDPVFGRREAPRTVEDNQVA